MSSVLKVDNIEKYYGSKANLTKAIDRIHRTSLHKTYNFVILLFFKNMLSPSFI